MEQPRAIEVVAVEKHYGTTAAGVNALHGISLSVDRGEFVAIVGPSGSGKSTLLNIVGALDRPTKGRVLIGGLDLSRMNNAELARLRNKEIGFVFQAFNLIPRMTAAENIALPMLIRGAGPKDRRRKALSLLQDFGITSKADRKPGELSGGEQQRVAVARALVNDPTILLADEPTGNLDSRNSELMMEIFERLNSFSKKTILMITHSAELASRAGHVVFIRDGQVDREELRN